ncbi:MAG: 1-phosphofructokinase family hexose kinase [Eubacteriales bacterium]
MKISTVTLNPAIDRAMYFRGEFRAGELNRAYKTVATVGGKGINVSRLLRRLGVESPAYGFIGGTDGKYLAGSLRGDGIDVRFTETAAPTRVNIKMIDGGGVCTEANESGGPVSENEMFELCAKIRSDILSEREASAENGTRQPISSSNKHDTDNIFVLGGSIPQGVENDVYNYLGEMFKSCGKRFVLDSSGAALREGMKSAPFMIKPNLEELSSLVGDQISTKSQAVEICKRLYVETGVSVLCTAGGNGAIFAGEGGFYTVTSPHVTLRGFVGAGDTFLAAFLSVISRGGDIPDALRFASSAAAAKVELPGTSLPDDEAQMAKFAGELVVEKV